MDDKMRLSFYTQMVRIRTYEEAIRREYHADKKPAWDIGAGLIPGEMHLSAGQEPVAVGLCANLRIDDGMTGPHRPHHLALAKGVDMKAMTAEIFGRTTGLGKGKGGHMHLFDPKTHFSCSGIIAEGIPVAVGQALAFSRRGTDNIAVGVAGEGAVNQGGFHEALNLAATWKLPVVFVIEDNEWAISVPKTISTSVQDVSLRAAGYGIPGVRVEGNDVEAIYEATKKAVDLARSGGGPSLIEIQTVRLWGHFEGDAQAYRGTELAEAEAKDPLPLYEAKLRKAGILDDTKVTEIKAEASKEVEAAIDFAKNSPTPEPADAYLHVFA
ncbi:MAG: thiamine pyrophosphate-dependent dehydrogenase E1 component subunit alpha [Actinomycetales bacterium]|nr:thiamine pyrophosphate-dependent dehydrogenase E1 component subunit alpha [Actinomycetales bacterium]